METQPFRDRRIVAALQRGDAEALESFSAEFRPILEAWARKNNVPRWEWPTCIYDVLTDEALRFRDERHEPPRNLAAYLVSAVRHRYLHLKRSAAYRDKWHAVASDDWSGEWVVSSACSESARRASAGPEASLSSMSDSLMRLATELGAGLTRDERLMLIWVSEGIPRTTIAKWMDMKPDACTKRIWRLCNRLRRDAVRYSARFHDGDRRDIERFLRRAAASR